MDGLNRLDHRNRAAAYAIAACVGTAAVMWSLAPATIAGTGGVFRFPQGDLSQNLTGHLAFQDPGWHWPPLRVPALAWPAGESIAMTDSNPALSVVAKLLAIMTGHRGNLMGAWFAACILLQPVAAVCALRSFARARPGLAATVISALTASALSLMLPAFLYRIMHINLFGHFLLMFALAYSVRLCVQERGMRFWPTVGFLLPTVFVHPYVFVFETVILAAPAIHLLLRGRDGARQAIRAWAIATLASIGAFLALSESLSVGGPGFGLYSMNLLAPVWPQVSGLFGTDLPILDATGFQREGFNYLGAGNLLLIGICVVMLAREGRASRQIMRSRFAGLGVSMIALTALAVTPRLTFGHTVLLPLDVPLLDHLLASVRASGRAIWAVDYAVILGSVAFLTERLQPRWLAPLMACVLALQWLDTSPLRMAAQRYFAGDGQAGPTFTMPGNTVLFSVVPWCASDEFTADGYRLDALRAGLHLKEVRLAHPPVPQACARALRAGLESALTPGETRLFLATAKLVVDPVRLGADAVCRTTPAGLVCSRT